MTMPSWLPLVAALALSPAAAAAQAPSSPPATAPQVLSRLEGVWSGRLERGGSQADITLHLAVKDDAIAGTFDWPDLGYRGADILGGRVLEDGTVRIGLPLPLGALRLLARAEGRTLSGRLEEVTRRANEWVTLPAEGSFTLTRSRGAPPPYSVRPVAFEAPGARIVGDIFLPHGARQAPGVVFIHGSGDSNRADGAFMADRFARAGMATLIYDKRGVGQSSGDWRKGGYEDLAADAAAALAALRATPGVDPARVGYVCRSEGCWVAPIAVAKGGAAFLAAISGPTVNVADEDIDHYRVALREAGVSETDTQRAFALIRRRHAVIAGRGDPAALAAEVAAVRSEPWFAHLNWEEAEDAATMTFRVRTIGYDPARGLRGLGLPSFWVYGTDDLIIPTGDSAARLISLQMEPRPKILVLPRADHALAVTNYPRLPGRVAEAADAISAWILSLGPERAAP